MLNIENKNVYRNTNVSNIPFTSDYILRHRRTCSMYYMLLYRSYLNTHKVLTFLMFSN